MICRCLECFPAVSEARREFERVYGEVERNGNGYIGAGIEAQFVRWAKVRLSTLLHHASPQAPVRPS
jgi:hypothetical protein